MRQQTINPDHPDLARAGDDILSKELDYIRKAYERARAALDEALKTPHRNEPLPFPIILYQDDLNYQVDRFQAVCEEIRFRNESMR